MVVCLLQRVTHPFIRLNRYFFKEKTHKYIKDLLLAKHQTSKST